MAARNAPQVDKAWRYVAVTFLVALVSVGLSLAVGPLVSPLLKDFGFSRTYLSGTIAMRQFLYGVFLVVTGRLSDRWGTRPVAAVGSVLLAAAMLLSAFTRSVPLFVVSFAILAPLGHAATGQTTLTTIIGRWFEKRRGLALTFLSAGGMGGMAIMTPLLSELIVRLSWRGAYVALAAFVLLIIGPAVLLGLAEPRTLPPATLAAAVPIVDDSSWRAALKTRPFWLLALGFFGCGFSMNLLSSSGVPMLESHGFDTMTASMGVGLIGLLAIFGSLALGAASDRFGRPWILAFIYAARGIGFLGLLLSGSTWQLYAVSVTAGLFWSGTASLTSALTADTYGTRWVGTLYGWMYLLHQIGGAIASYLAGWAFMNLGSYALPFGMTVVLLFISGTLSTRVPGRRRTPAPAAA